MKEVLNGACMIIGRLVFGLLILVIIVGILSQCGVLK
jgi:hypothetical protein